MMLADDTVSRHLAKAVVNLDERVKKLEKGNTKALDQFQKEFLEGNIPYPETMNEFAKYHSRIKQAFLQLRKELENDE